MVIATKETLEKFSKEFEKQMEEKLSAFQKKMANPPEYLVNNPDKTMKLGTAIMKFSETASKL